MKFGSVCSGISAASHAWNQLGWHAAWFNEIDRFPSSVLAQRHPEVPNLGDMTLLPARIRSGEVEAPPLLCGGTPCQAFSVAGNRKSLDDARGNLTLTFCEIANEIDDRRVAAGDPECVVFWENVPGVLSTKDNAFGCFLAGLAGEDEPLVPPGPAPKPGRPFKWSNAGVVLGPRRAVAWRTLDAQYFGLAQRRRRVFVVASAREGFDPAAVLFEPEGLRRDLAPRREAGQETAGTLAASLGGCDENDAANGRLVVAFGGNNTAGAIDVATACNASSSASGRLDFESETFVVQGSDHEVAATLDASFGRLQGASGQDARHGHSHLVVVDQTPRAWAVRRLTEVECERLQGFADGHTDVTHNGKPAPSGRRYKAIGNSWAVNCVRWIGGRIDAAMRPSIWDLLA